MSSDSADFSVLLTQAREADRETRAEVLNRLIRGQTGWLLRRARQHIGVSPDCAWSASDVAQDVLLEIALLNPFRV